MVLYISILPRLIYELFKKNEINLVKQLQIWIENKNEKFNKICLLAFSKLLHELSQFLELSMNSIYAYVEKGKNIVKENRSDWPSVF